MSLTVQQARDVQHLVRWVSGLTAWDHPDGDHAEEPLVADAVTRLATAAHERLADTGQGRGPTPAEVAAAPSVAWMRGERS